MPTSVRCMLLLGALLGVLSPATAQDGRGLVIGIGGVSTSAVMGSAHQAHDILSSAGRDVDFVAVGATNPLTTDLSDYQQIWVLDFSPAADAFTSSYQSIAAWYAARAGAHLIVDGRMLGSLGFNQAALESQLMLNYFDNLAGSGGGLVLGTDHDTFAFGINTLNGLIGLAPFAGFWFEEPFKAMVDVASPLMSYPQAAYKTGAALDDPPFYVTDNSSTSDVPFNLQPGGQVLHAVAWHGATPVDGVAISTTLVTAPVPEPQTYALLLAGLGLLIFAARRRARAR